MVTKIKYKCGNKDCKKVYECKIGYNARVDCMHQKADGVFTHWYPVKIIEIIVNTN